MLHWLSIVSILKHPLLFFSFVCVHYRADDNQQVPVTNLSNRRRCLLLLLLLSLLLLTSGGVITGILLRKSTMQGKLAHDIQIQVQNKAKRKKILNKLITDNKKLDAVVIFFSSNGRSSVWMHHKIDYRDSCSILSFIYTSSNSIKPSIRILIDMWLY